MTYDLIISNSIAQEANYKDIALALGWVEGESEQAWQDVITDHFYGRAINVASMACLKQEQLKGQLNYNAEQMIEAFKATTTVKLVEVV